MEINTRYATLSNYENNKTIPSDDMLGSLAEQLGETPYFFKDERWNKLSVTCFNQKLGNNKKDIELAAYLKVTMEKHLAIDKLLHIKPNLPEIELKNMPQLNIELIEAEAKAFRNETGAGFAPISSVCNILENHGWYLFELPPSFGYPSISGFSTAPGHLFLAFRANDRPEELRYELLKAVGYSRLTSDDPTIREKAVSYFAKAVLLPKEQISLELGDKISDISHPELSVLKQKYGLSRRRIAERLNELHFLSAEKHRQYILTLKKYGYPLNRGLRDEMLSFHELPEYFKQKVLRARTEGLLTQDEAEQLYPF